MTNLPAHLQNAVVPDFVDRTLANLGTAMPPYVSIKGNRFTLIDSTGAEEPVTTVDPKTGMFYLDAVILDSLEFESKMYFAKAYDPNSEGARPDCWSDNGIGPSRHSSSPQSPTCAGCEKAEWGSAVSRVSGKGVPACGKYQKIALMLPGDDILFLLRVPPNSLKNLRDYLGKFKGQNYKPPDWVTRISFAKDTLGTLIFQGASWIDEAMAAQRSAAYQAKATDVLVGRGDQPREGVARVAAPAPVQQLAPPASQTPFNQAPPNVANPPAQAIPQTNGAAQPEQRRRRRTKAEMEADAAKQPGSAAAQPQQAPFQTAPMPGGAPFGIQAGVAPDTELSKTIDGLFPPQ